MLLPITFFNPMREKLFSLSNSIVFYLHIILTIFMIINRNKCKYINRFVKATFITVVLLNFSSIIMSSILYYNLSAWLNRTTFTAILPYILYYFQITIAVFTNYYYFEKYGIEVIKNSLNIICIWNLILGYIQIIIIKFDISFIEKFYKFFVEIFIDRSYVINIQRVCLATTEASMAGSIIVILILPYILANILSNNSKKFIILFLLYFPIIYFTESSSVYLGLIVNIVVYLFIAIKNRLNFKLILGTMYFIFLMMLIVSLFIVNNAKYNNKIFNEIKYVSIEKLTDNNNLSTIHRSTSLYTNYKAVKKHPFLGVGNGNQGFYYKMYFPEWGYKSYESKAYINGEGGWPGSGGFLSSYISGYGIFGIMLLVNLVVVSYKGIKRIDKKLMYMYKIGVWSFFIMGITTIDIIGNYYIMFLISIPAFDIKNEEK